MVLLFLQRSFFESSCPKKVAPSCALYSIASPLVNKNTFTFSSADTYTIRSCMKLSLRHYFAGVVLLGLFIVPSATVFASSNGTITGHVVDGNNAALAGATVSGSGKTAITDSVGNYTIRNIPSGNEVVTASKVGYNQALVQVSVAVHQTTTVPTLQLFAAAPTYGNISGRVTSASTGTGVASASVIISKTTFQQSTDSNGNYSFSTVPSGTQTLAASASGYQTMTQTITVTQNATTTANFSLTPLSSTTPPSSGIYWNGSTTYLLGADYPWWNYATDFGTGGWGKFTDWTTIDADFATMASQGVHVTRWWLFGDGRYDPVFNSDGTVAGLDPSFLPNIDQALQIAAKYHIYITFSLIDNTMWAPATYSGSVQMGGHSAIVTDTTTQQTFLDNAVKPLLQHIAASPNRQWVLGFDIVSEPEAQMAGYWGGVNLQPSAVQTFVQRVASYIHSYGGGVYATLDSAQPAYVSTWKNLGLDFYEFHYYPWMDQGGAPGSGLPTYTSLNLDKPAVVSEFQTANDASYTIGDTTPLSAEWYLDTIYKDGYAGALAWSYRAADSVSNWSAFQPVFTNLAAAHASYIGPQ